MTLHESSLRIILRDNFKGGFFMREKMLVTQALDERDLLVKKISDKIDKARGYCDCDVWEMFSFLQTLIPDMLQTLKDTRTGSPGYLGENYTNENGILVNDTCHEEWNCILDKMIFLWREAEKDTCSQKNPFDEAHSKAMDEFTERFGLFGNKLQTEKELEENRKRGGGGTIHFMDKLPEYKEISDKYREEEKRLEEYRRKCKDEAIDMLKQYFYDLWD